MKIAAIVFITLMFLGCNNPLQELDTRLNSLNETVSELKKSIDSNSIERGRFQIVNPTPKFAMNITLLDTATGKTWVTCKTKENEFLTENNWCAQEFVGSGNNPE